MPAVDWDRLVGVATGYGLDVPGIECRWRRDFPHPSRPPLGPTQLPLDLWVCFPGVKRPGRGIDPSHPSISDVKERVELYLYSASGPLWPIVGCTLRAPAALTLKAFGITRCNM